jgi:hypothetical protein
MLSSFASRLKSYLDPAAHGSDAAGAPLQGRRDLRFTQQDRRIGIRIGDERQAFVLGNLSTRGAAGEVERPPAVGQAVVIEFERGIEVRGTVKWVSDNRIGIAFITGLPMDVVDGSVRQSAGRAPREPRYSIARSATITVGTVRAPIAIVNVSSGGMRVTTPFPLVPGQSVKIEAGTMPPIAGRVRWSKVDSAGIKLDAPLSLDEFDRATEDCRISHDPA